MGKQPERSPQRQGDSSKPKRRPRRRASTPSKTSDALHRLRVLLAEFQQAHRQGTEALLARDYKRVSAVIAREADLIRLHKALIAQQQARMSRSFKPPVIVYRKGMPRKPRG